MNSSIINNMDNSQGSDVFSESVDMFCDSPTNMDGETYGNLIANTKSALSKKCKNGNSFFEYFTSLLDDCELATTQSLDLVIDMFSKPCILVETLMEYMNNIIEILQMLSDYIKYLVESVALACKNLKTFPTITGRILVIVFSHCKDSEVIYGRYLGTVEKQLKDLFHACHELQMTYLMVMERHVIFDFTQKDDQDLFVEALDIILKIGETVHKLDVKTMAEQWKAFTAICEKYSTHMEDKDIFNNSTNILCGMIEKNIIIADEMSLDEKVSIRSAKVTSFLIKILIKVCTILKHATVKTYEHILELLIFIYLQGTPYLELTGKPSSFITLMETNITVPAECLLKELLLDEQFVRSITTYDVSKIGNKDNLLGFLLLIAATMKTELQINDENRSSNIKIQLFECVYRILPYGHVWFNLGLKIRNEVEPTDLKTYGLYEHLLIHTLALVVTMNKKEYISVEERMIYAILSTDCMSAMFSANLWTLLTRFLPRELLLTEVLTLCKFYKQLENHISFENSPQRVHITYTIHKLFKTMNCEDRVKMYKMLPIFDNMNVWCVLEINNLPEEIQRTTENALITKLSKLAKDRINFNDETTVMKLASTFNFSNDSALVNNVVHAWMKLCTEDNSILAQCLATGALWCVKFMEALASLTCSIVDVLCGRNVDLIKVLHVVSKLTRIDCLESKLLLMKVLYKFCTSKTYDGNATIERVIVQSFKNIVQNCEPIIINSFFSLLYENIGDTNLNRVFKIVLDMYDLDKRWLELEEKGKMHYLEEKRILEGAKSLEFSHRCIDIQHDLMKDCNVNEDTKSGSNFDLLDLNNLFDSESDTEPQCKRVKLNNSGVNEIVARIETDVLKLCKLKENISGEDKLKIKDFCIRLQNIVD